SRPCCYQSSARSSRKRLLNARRVASGEPPGFPESRVLKMESPPCRGVKRAALTRAYLRIPWRRRLRPRRRRKGGQYAVRCSGLRRTWPPSCTRSCRLPELKDLVAFLSELHALGIDLFLHQQGLDTTTPAGKAMFQMLGVFAE